MKKLFALLLVLCMASLACASIVTLVDDGLTITATPGETVKLNVTTDTALIGLDVIATVVGGDVIVDATGSDDIHLSYYVWDSVSYPIGLGTPTVEIGCGNFNGNYNTIVAYFDVLYTGGEQVLSIAPGTKLGGSMDVFYGLPTISGMVTIIPEPATLALLGLGALAILRRRK